MIEMYARQMNHWYFLEYCSNIICPKSSLGHILFADTVEVDVFPPRLKAAQ